MFDVRFCLAMTWYGWVIVAHGCLGLRNKALSDLWNGRELLYRVKRKGGFQEAIASGLGRAANGWFPRLAMVAVSRS